MLPSKSSKTNNPCAPAPTQTTIWEATMFAPLTHYAENDTLLTHKTTTNTELDNIRKQRPRSPQLQLTTIPQQLTCHGSSRSSNQTICLPHFCQSSALQKSHSSTFITTSTSSVSTPRKMLPKRHSINKYSPKNVAQATLNNQTQILSE